MNPAAVLGKTAKGREEIAARRYGLSARMRQLLIMVDGARSAYEIARSHASLDECFALLEELRAEGFIEPEDGVASPSAASVVDKPSAPVADGAAADRITLAKRYLTEFVQGTMGAGAGNVIERIGRCDSRTELDAIARSCGEVVAAVAGRRKAEQFLAELQQVFGDE